MHEHPERHIYDDKGVEEGESVRQHIGEMEAVPDVVELADDEAEYEEYQQTAAEYALTLLDL